MRKLGSRRKPSSPRDIPANQAAQFSVRHLLFAIAALSAVILVLIALPQGGDLSEQTLRIAKKNIEEHSKPIKGVVVSHGFLKINVNVAYRSRSQATKNGNLPKDPKGPETPSPLRQRGDDVKIPDKIKPTNVTGPSSKSSLEVTSTSLEPEPNPPPPSTSRPTTTPPIVDLPVYHAQSKDDIVVDVLFHRVLSPEPNSLLTCRMSEEDLANSLKAVTKIWRSQAKIVLRYSSRALYWENLSMDAEKSFEDHLLRFPKNDETGQPWTTENPGRIGLVGNELIQILSPSPLDRWTTANPVNVFCIGAFVGYNGVTWNRHVFIRSVQYHKTDSPMDAQTFTRIMAHEIGHVLNLPHPGADICSQPCESSTCNLMCQQRSLPAPVDPRMARSLTSLQVSRARTAAALVDVFSSARFNRNAHVFGIPTETLPNVRASKSQIVFMAQPISSSQSLVISRINMVVSKIKSSCTVALLVGKVSGDMVSARVKAIGTMSNTLVKEGLSRLVFDDLDNGWWTNARHLEVEISPPLNISPGSVVGLAFSVSGVSVQMVKRTNQDMLYLTKATSSVFSTVKSTPTDLKAERIIGQGPIFNVVVFDEEA